MKAKARKPYGTDGVRPSGRVLVHNHVRRHANMPNGANGFRAWYDFLDAPRRFRRITSPGEPPPKYIVCKCGWRPDLGTHYRIKGVGSANYRVESGSKFVRECFPGLYKAMSPAQRKKLFKG
jgi:hypothetical protein